MKLSKKSLIVQLRHLPHSSHCSHCSHCSHSSHCSHNRLCGSYPIAPTIACTPPNSKFRIPFVAPINSEFKIQNSKFNFSLLKVRSMKLLSLFLHTFTLKTYTINLFQDKIRSLRLTLPPFHKSHKSHKSHNSKFKIQNSLLALKKYICEEYSPFIIPYKLESNPLNTPFINDFLPVLYCSESIDT
mgnify:CR=1 FL=1